MNWIRLHRRSALLIFAAALLPLAMYGYVFAALLGQGLDYAEQSSRLEPRIARIQGLMAERERVLARSRDATRAAGDRFFPESEDASALSASLQAQLRQLLAESGMRVSNSQVLPLREEDGFQRVAIKLTADGSLAALDAALAGVAAARPQLLIEDFAVYPSRVVRRGDSESQIVTAVIQIFALRALA